MAVPQRREEILQHPDLLPGIAGIDSGVNQETTNIAAVQGGRGGARITVTAPLKMAHPAGTPLAGSGITLTTPLVSAHPRSAVVTVELPTPGAANKYSNLRAAR